MEESCMYKSIIFSCLFILLTACGNDKLPKDCQEMYEVVEKINLELDTNIYVPTDLAKKNKELYKFIIKGFENGHNLKQCKAALDTMKKKLKSLKEAKSEKEVREIIMT